MIHDNNHPNFPNFKFLKKKKKIIISRYNAVRSVTVLGFVINSQKSNDEGVRRSGEIPAASGVSLPVHIALLILSPPRQQLVTVREEKKTFTETTSKVNPAGRPTARV